jgi:hypothetical protein
VSLKRNRRGRGLHVGELDDGPLVSGGRHGAVDVEGLDTVRGGRGERRWEVGDEGIEEGFLLYLHPRPFFLSGANGGNDAQCLDTTK